MQRRARSDKRQLAHALSDFVSAPSTSKPDIFFIINEVDNLVYRLAFADMHQRSFRSDFAIIGMAAHFFFGIFAGFLAH